MAPSFSKEAIVVDVDSESMRPRWYPLCGSCDLCGHFPQSFEEALWHYCQKLEETEDQWMLTNSSAIFGFGDDGPWWTADFVECAISQKAVGMAKQLSKCARAARGPVCQLHALPELWHQHTIKLADGLPAGWKVAYSMQHRAPYYFHTEYGMTRWERPGMKFV
jgi:hypothetical protein